MYPFVHPSILYKLLASAFNSKEVLEIAFLNLVKTNTSDYTRFDPFWNYNLDRPIYLLESSYNIQTKFWGKLATTPISQQIRENLLITIEFYINGAAAMFLVVRGMWSQSGQQKALK